MSWENVVEAVAAGTGASVSVAALARRWFRSAVQGVVKDALSDLEKRQGRHLDHQDRRLDRIERKLDGLR